MPKRRHMIYAGGRAAALASIAACQACRIDGGAIPVEAQDAAPVLAAEDAGGEDAMMAIIHGSCREPPPFPAPALPAIATTSSGRPEFDLFRELDCADLEHYPSCDAAPESLGPLECARCLGNHDSERAGGAVCVPRAQRGCIAVAHGAGCISCVAPEAKAQACCLGLEIDCRRWPFEQRSGPGELCARHDDCEAGLLCKALAGETRFGVCSCPEHTPELPFALDACLEERSP